MSVLYLPEKFGSLLWVGENTLCLPGFVLNYILLAFKEVVKRKNLEV